MAAYASVVGFGTVSPMTRTSTLDAPTGVAVLDVLERGVEAAESARQARANRQRVADRDIDSLVASWQLSRSCRPGELTETQIALAGSHGYLAIEVGTAMVKAKLAEHKGRNGWLDARYDEVKADAQAWVIERMAEYRPGQGAVLAFVASRLSWIVGELVRTHSQGGSNLDRSSYVVRAAAWGAMSDLREAGKDATEGNLRAATIERLVRDKVAKDIAEGTEPSEAYAKAIASIKKSGRFAALDRINELVNSGDSDVSLQASVGDDETVQDRLANKSSRAVSNDDIDQEDALSQFYRVAVGDHRWADAALVARHGGLGIVEGTGSIDVEDGTTSSRPATIPALSKATGHSRDEVRTVLNNAGSRLTSAHAQFAHLGGVEIHTPSSRLLAGFDNSVFADN